jgi:hypothetical protein
MSKHYLSAIKGLLRRVQVWRLLRKADKVIASRRVVESRNDFKALRLRLDRENQLHALMLSQRVFRKGQ